MNKSDLKKLVKEYFSLVEKDNTENIEETKETFAVATLADGTKVTNDKAAELAVGDSLFVITEEGDKVQAPSGEHVSDSGITITVSDEGIITGIHRPDEAGEGSLEDFSAEEVSKEEESIEEASEEKTELAEHDSEEEEVMEEHEDEKMAIVLQAIAEETASRFADMEEKLSSCMDELKEHKDKLAEVEEKMKEHYSKESSAPSITSSKFSKGNVGQKPEMWEYTPKNPKQLHYDAVMSRLNK